MWETLHLSLITTPYQANRVAALTIEDAVASD